MTKHALIIDDTGDNLRILARLLEKEGVTSTQVNHPKNLDTTLQNAVNFDVVFCDLELPEMNGYEIVEKLKATGKFDKSPFIAYTVHVSEMHVAHSYGFNGFIGKPLDSDKFSGQLKRILNGEEVWETL